MNRGIFGALALLAATFATPATAAPSFVVYEVVRAPSAPTGVEVEIEVVGSGPTVFMTATLVPDGGGYDAQTASAHAPEDGGYGGSVTLLLRGRERFLVGGERGRLRVTVAARGWSVRTLGSGFRYVRADGVPVVPGVQEFGSATAAAGAYGSIAFATVPCERGAGSWTIAAENEPGRSFTCPVEQAFAFHRTQRARRWRVDAELYGILAEEMRLAVLDFPKRVQ